MSLCNQLRAYLDGEMSLMGRWRVEAHLRRCPACQAQRAADETLAPHLTASGTLDTPAEAAAIARLTRAWEAGAAAAAVAPRVRRRSSSRVVTASAVLAFGACALAVFALTAPTRAIAEVKDAMKKVRRFHIRVDVPGTDLRYEAWGDRRVGARVEEWENGEMTMLALDDGKRLRGYFPQEKVVRETGTHFKELMRDTGGFKASRLLTHVAQGELFETQEWIGEPHARGVSRVVQDGVPQERVELELKEGFFEKMVIYADPTSDRLTQADLYMSKRRTDEGPFIRVFFDYPQQIDPKLLRNVPMNGRRERWHEQDLQLP